MTKGISINFLANVQPVLKGTGDVEAAFQKVGTSLDDVTGAGVDSTKKLEASFSQLAEQQIASSTQARNAQIRDQQSVTNGMELSAREQNRIQREGLKTGAATITQTVAQSVQGFDGTAAGILATAQNVGAGIASLATGPLAIIAAAGTLAFSVISGVISKAQADTKAEQADVEALTTSLEKVGIKGVTSVSAVNTSLEKMSTTTDGTDKDLSHLKETADSAGVSWVTYARALAGSTTDQEKLYATIQKQIAALEKQINLTTTSTKGHTQDNASLKAQLAALNDVRGALEKQNSELGLSKDRVNELSQARERATASAAADSAAQKAYSTDTLATFDDIGSQLEAKQAEIDAAAVASSKKTKTAVSANNVETAQSFLDTQAAELAALTNNNQAKIQIYEKFGADADKVIKEAGSNTNLLQSLAGADPTQVAAIIANYGSLGAAAAANLKKDAQLLLDEQPITVKPIKIPLDLDTAAAQQKLGRLGNGLIITVGGIVTRNGTKIL